MRSWQRDLSLTVLIVHLLYGSVLIYMGMIAFRVPDIPRQWEPTYQLLFLVLVVVAVFMLPISWLLGGARMNPDKLREQVVLHTDREQGLVAAAGLVRLGAIIMAALGEANAIYGLVIYFLTGDPIRPWVFIALTVVHYVFTMTKLRNARDALEELGR